MKKIATHNSATGERGKGFLSWIVTPFARCQSKTIKEQYEAGCRMFDIRVIKKEDEYYCAHGVWTSERTAMNILSEIDSFPTSCYVSLTYEGMLASEEEKNWFLAFALNMRNLLPSIKWGPVSVRYADKDIVVDWVSLMPAAKWAKNRKGYLPLDGSTWHTYLPIPWLWNKLYPRLRTLNTYQFTFIDFL